MKKLLNLNLIKILITTIIIVIILLIFVPIILNFINTYREKEFKSMANAIYETSKLEYLKQKQKNAVVQEVKFKYIDGKEAINVTDRKLNYKGTKPSNGEVVINMDGQVALALYSHNFCAKKNFDQQQIKWTNDGSENCKISDNEQLIKADKSGASSPKFNNNMIPIKWLDNKWVKADQKNPEGPNKWYDYDSQMWANVVVVSSNTRGKYLNAQLGTEIKEEDVMAYFVWIPRYKYKLFNVASLNINPQKVDIVFESKEKEKSTGTIDKEYLTHPAFTLGDKELDGIWVGKFETTGTAAKPTIKPNNKSLTNQRLDNQFITSKKFNDSENYGLSSINDAHIMKNIEWGAVAYLSQSKYGKYGNPLYTDEPGLEREIYNNNINATSKESYLSTITGCAGNSLGAEMVNKLNCPDDNKYDKTQGFKASTTGNIYGIYDMSGGSWEVVAGGQYDDKNEAIEIGSSGFEKSKIKEGDTIKYLDIYSFGVIATDFNNRRMLGDATGEVRGWNNDMMDFIETNNPWFIRGGVYNSGKKAGIFSFSNSTGGSYSNYGFRVVVLG